MTRYARRRDDSHAPIRNALKAAGVWVWETVDAGNGFPDLLCWRKPTGFVLLEVKTPGSDHSKRKAGNASGKTQARQEKFRAVCPGPVHVVSTVEEAFAALGVGRAA
jgi:hypothetical protein